MTMLAVEDRVAALHVDAGDQIVLFLRDRFLPGQYEAYRDIFARHFPGIPVLVMEDGASLGVLRHVAVDPRA
jgi:hypothetical protein